MEKEWNVQKSANLICKHFSYIDKTQVLPLNVLALISIPFTKEPNLPCCEMIDFVFLRSYFYIERTDSFTTYYGFILLYNNLYHKKVIFIKFGKVVCFVNLDDFMKKIMKNKKIDNNLNFKILSY